MSFQDRVVLLVGATGGFGPHLARAVSARGATLVLAARSEGALATLAQDPALEPKTTSTAVVDAADALSVAGVVAQTQARFGRIDVLLNVVGGFSGGKAVHEMDEEDWDGMLDLNARAVFLLCRAVVPGMISRGQGAIVNVASALGLAATAGTSAYAASKAALLRLTEAVAAEAGPHGVRANAVVPGTLDTEANRKAMPGADRRLWVQPDDLARVICFLASDEARGVNGAALRVGS